MFPLDQFHSTNRLCSVSLNATPISVTAKYGFIFALLPSSGLKYPELKDIGPRVHEVVFYQSFWVFSCDGLS